MTLTADDRLALRELAERYALGVDQRRAADVAALFAVDGVLVVPHTPTGNPAPIERVGRERIERAMGSIARYERTLHAIVGHVVDAGDEADGATGVVSCIAHHVLRGEDGTLSALVWAMHYADTYVREDGAWRFGRRVLDVDFIETRWVDSVRSHEGAWS